METIWVLENVNNDSQFYSESLLLMLFASVSLWRKYHPHHKTVFYCDEISYNFIKKFSIEYLWDDIRIFSYNNKINKKIFWSSSKTNIISKTNIPLLVIDHDFLIFKNIDKYLKDYILYTYDEIANNWYPGEHDIFSSKLSTPIKKLVNYAANVSLFYLPNPDFANEYGLQTLKNHEEFSKMNSEKINTNYMILSEQFMLKQWLVEKKISHKQLSKNIWDCKNVKYTDKLSNNGIMNLKESLLYYKHYGVEKKKLLRKDNIKKYNDTINFLYRCINAGKKIDVVKLRKDINKEINESNTCKLDKTIF